MSVIQYCAPPSVSFKQSRLLCQKQQQDSEEPIVQSSRPAGALPTSTITITITITILTILTILTIGITITINTIITIMISITTSIPFSFVHPAGGSELAHGVLPGHQVGRGHPTPGQLTPNSQSEIRVFSDPTLGIVWPLPIRKWVSGQPNPWTKYWIVNSCYGNWVYTRLVSNSAPAWSSRCCFTACHL